MLSVVHVPAGRAVEARGVAHRRVLAYSAVFAVARGGGYLARLFGEAVPALSARVALGALGRALRRHELADGAPVARVHAGLRLKPGDLGGGGRGEQAYASQGGQSKARQQADAGVAHA